MYITQKHTSIQYEYTYLLSTNTYGVVLILLDKAHMN